MVARGASAQARAAGCTMCVAARHVSQFAGEFDLSWPYDAALYLGSLRVARNFRLWLASCFSGTGAAGVS